jgi:hypothetical protein
MRRQLFPITLAIFTLMALSAGAAPAVGDEAPVLAPSAVAVQRVSVSIPGVRDEAAMVLVGAALLGLASAVRRAG